MRNNNQTRSTVPTFRVETLSFGGNHPLEVLHWDLLGVRNTAAEVFELMDGNDNNFVRVLVCGPWGRQIVCQNFDDPELSVMINDNVPWWVD